MALPALHLHTEPQDDVTEIDVDARSLAQPPTRPLELPAQP